MSRFYGLVCTCGSDGETRSQRYFYRWPRVKRRQRERGDKPSALSTPSGACGSWKMTWKPNDLALSATALPTRSDTTHDPPACSINYCDNHANSYVLWPPNPWHAFLMFQNFWELVFVHSYITMRPKTVTHSVLAAAAGNRTPTVDTQVQRPNH